MEVHRAFTHMEIVVYYYFDMKKKYACSVSPYIAHGCFVYIVHIVYNFFRFFLLLMLLYIGFFLSDVAAVGVAVAVPCITLYTQPVIEIGLLAIEQSCSV